MSTDPKPATITIDLGGWFNNDDDESNGGGIKADVIREAARMLLGRLDQQVALNIASEVTAGVRARVDAEVESVIREKLTDAISITNSYGEPTGERTTLRETIAKRAKDWLDERVNDRGEPSSYHRDTGCARLQWIIRTEAASAVDAAMKAEIATAVGELKKQIAGKLSGMLGEALQKLIGIPV